VLVLVNITENPPGLITPLNATLRVYPVNTRPVFTLTNSTVSAVEGTPPFYTKGPGESAIPFTTAGFVVNISKMSGEVIVGPSGEIWGEDAQNLLFIVELVDGEETLFSTFPSIDATTGALTYGLAEEGSGSATFR
jgi:hypothetical protein